MARVLVAGATGYVGRYVVAECKRRGDWVRALARDPDRLGRPGPFGEPAVAEFADEVFVGEATRPETLEGLCRNIDVVFSSVGITRQADRLSPMDVDFQGNMNILARALSDSASKFVFVHVFGAESLRDLEVVRAKERFARELRSSGLECSVVRPTGLFNDMTEFLRMARKGVAYLIGDGSRRINPLHGADLACVCADAMRNGGADLPAGGPTTYTHREIAELAFAALGAPPRVRRVPTWAARLAARSLRPFSRRRSDVARALVAMATKDFVAPPVGSRALKAYFEEMARGPVGSRDPAAKTAETS